MDFLESATLSIAAVVVVVSLLVLVYCCCGPPSEDHPVEHATDHNVEMQELNNNIWYSGQYLLQGIADLQCLEEGPAQWMLEVNALTNVFTGSGSDVNGPFRMKEMCRDMLTGDMRWTQIYTNKQVNARHCQGQWTWGQQGQPHEFHGQWSHHPGETKHHFEWRLQTFCPPHQVEENEEKVVVYMDDDDHSN